MPLYALSVTLLTWKYVSTFNPAIPSLKLTVIVVVATEPSPDLMLLIPVVPPVGPTIRNSSTFGSMVF